MAEDLPHPGCNCGRRRSVPLPPPLLVPDLVIAARDRAREPELPAATVERALNTPITPRLARYDVIVLSPAANSPEPEARLVAEFARHEHRVFVLRGAAAVPGAVPLAPTVHPVTDTVYASRDTNAIVASLAELRREQQIEAAAIALPMDADPTLAQQVRDRWGWRVVTASAAPVALAQAADLLLAFDAPAAMQQGKVLPLPADQPWPARWAAIDAALRQTWPRASVVLLTHDNLAFNRLCLASLFENTDYPNYELILVDNASADGTVDELRRLTSSVPNITLIENAVNAGFGGGNNQGMAAATGSIFVLLNNDTVVPRGWLTRLARHLDDPLVGLVGPATNRTCNEAQRNPPYQTYAEYQAVARAFGQQHEGERRPIRMLAMFCTAFRRDVYDRVGPLDERYEVGMFEDEDYALRVKELGLDVVWTPEVYVHHAYHASIGKLLPSGEYTRLVHLNQGRFEEKWGICWERHRPLPPTAS
jgi:GT2 family glycosyltransferase